MKLKLTLIVLFCFIIEGLFCQSAICSYKYRKRIKFDPTKVGATASVTDLTGFPALISITSDNDLRTIANSGHVSNANGYDIVFTSEDGVTLLNFQLETYTATTGKFVAWVNIPTLSTSINTYIYMYYGNAAITTDQSSTGTWDANFKGVYHLNTTYNDYTATGNNGTNNGFTLGAGMIVNGGLVNATSDYVSLGTTGWSTSTATYEVWVNSTSTWPATEAYFMGHTTMPAYNSRVQIYSYNGRLRIGLGNSHSIGGDLFTFSTSTWYHVAVTYSSGSFTVYVNGASVYTGTYTALTAIGQADIGNNGDDHTQAMTGGSIDELKISNTVRSADWILTEYNNQNSPSTFYSITSEPRVWTGGTNTNWSAATNWTPNGAPAANEDVIISNGTNQPTLNTAPNQLSSMWIQSGATLSMSSQTLSIKFDVTNCGTITGNTGTLNMNGTSTDIQSQYLSGSGTFNLNNLTVNNTFSPSPALRLLKDVNVSGVLTLTSGITYTTTTNILALSSTATSSSGLATSFVSGPMSKDGTANFIFPVGKGTRWRRVSVTGLSATSTFRAEYFNTAYSNTTSITSPLYNVSVLEYWQLDRTSGSANATVSLYWENAGTSGITNCPDLTIAHWSGSSWGEYLATTAVGSSCSGAGTGSVVTNAAASTFSPFTFGSKLSVVNPLPIELLKFTATPCEKEVCLEWSTATETNNDHFTVEKTKDGAKFETVSTVEGAGNSSSVLNYLSSDHAPYEGVSYYRLKQTDYNGAYTYSDLEMVDFETAEKLDFNIYPNPNDGSEIYIKLIGEQWKQQSVLIHDAMGRKIHSQEVIISKDKNQSEYKIDYKSKLSSGIYLITVINNQKSSSKKLIVK